MSMRTICDSCGTVVQDDDPYLRITLDVRPGFSRTRYYHFCYPKCADSVLNSIDFELKLKGTEPAHTLLTEED